MFQNIMRLVALLALVPCFIVPTLVRADILPGAPPNVAATQTGDRDRAIGCLAAAIAYEAGHEPVEGQQAVAEVVMNRLRHASFPKTVCGVVFAGAERRTGCQFSFTCDGSLNRRMSAAVMANARAIAIAALDGQTPLHVVGATHYHADYVSPYWAPSLVRVAKIGAHIFYRGAGWPDRLYSTNPYLPGAEPQFAALGLDASAANPASGARAPMSKPPSVFAPWGLTPPKGN